MENKLVGLSRKSTSTKNWSKSPTSEYLTDIAESIITKEWRDGCKLYKSTRLSRYRWLVAYVPRKEEDFHDVWLDSEDDVERDTPNIDKSLEGVKHFGLIPKFSRAYEVMYNKTNSVLECSCGQWSRLRIPCRHLAAVINQNDELSNLYPTGFPMSSVSVRWMNDYYYYGLQENDISNSTFGKALSKLCRRDSHGLYCPKNIKEDITYSPDDHIVKLFNAPAKHCL